MHLLTLGHGYSAQWLARSLLAEGWRVTGTTRRPDKAEAIRASGVTPVLWPGDIGPALTAASHVLISAAPGAEGDPFLAHARGAIAASRPDWIGYLSSTGIYGDHQGGWVDEETPPNAPQGHRDRRLAAEEDWRGLARAEGLPLHVFRLAGIYGPGRGPFQKLRDGTARRIVKPGQVFSRIHVEDIVATLRASMARPDPGAVYNVCDDEPAAPEVVIEEAARLLNMPPPPAIAYEEADLPPMARAFYRDNRRVRNERIKRELGVVLRYPTYREGLASLAGLE